MFVCVCVCVCVCWWIGGEAESWGEAEEEEEEEEESLFKADAVRRRGSALRNCRRRKRRRRRRRREREDENEEQGLFKTNQVTEARADCPSHAWILLEPSWSRRDGTSLSAASPAFCARPWFAKLEPDSGMVDFTGSGTLRSTHSCPPGGKGYYEVEIIRCLAIKLLSSSSSPHLDSAVALRVLVGHCVSFE